MDKSNTFRHIPTARALQIAAVVILATIVVAGCGGSGTAESSTSETSNSSAATTTVPRATTSTAVITTTSNPPDPGDREMADLQAIADAAGNAIILVSDEHGTTTVVSGVGEQGAVIQPDDAFFIASGSKMLTAAAVLQLVDQGLVGLDDLLEDYVDFEVATPITIRHLLQHKSGLGDEDSIYGTCDPDEVMAGLAAEAVRPFNMEPGVGAAYSTNGFNMLSLVMSSATGQATVDVFRQNMFDPLEMNSTFFTGAEDGPVLVVGEESWDPDCEAETMDIGTGGGFASSAPDLHIFMQALFGGDLLTEESLNEMMTLDSKVFGFDYGLGVGAPLYPSTGQERPMYGHWGSGWEAGALYDPQAQRIVVALTEPNRGFLGVVWAATGWADGN
jgi:D-alanyl-D-alanine carboxypeptidase